MALALSDFVSAWAPLIHLQMTVVAEISKYLTKWKSQETLNLEVKEIDVVFTTILDKENHITVRLNNESAMDTSAAGAMENT